VKINITIIGALNEGAKGKVKEECGKVERIGEEESDRARNW
jgi:hypothetical protein